MIPTNLELRRGDLMPPLILDLTDEDEDGNTILVPTSEATSVSVIARKNGVMLFKRAADGSTDGQAKYEWVAGDTDTPGTLTVEAEIIWAGGKPQTIRPAGVVKILPDLG
jgi:hypothetical protein